MDEEFYFEETGNKKKYIILFIFVVIFTLGFIYYVKTHTLKVVDVIKYEVGDPISKNIKDYVKNREIDPDDFKLILPKDLKLDGDTITNVGEFKFKVKHDGKTKKGKIVVTDTKAPEVEINDLTVGLKEEFEVDDFIKVCNEYSKPCNISYKNEKDEELNQKEGNYKIDIIISDKYDNKVTKEVNLTVKKGYSFEEQKQNDLNAYRIYPNYSDWDGSLVINYRKAFDSNDFDNDRLSYLYNMAEEELSLYLPIGYQDEEIEDSEIIYVYNKYNYIVGFAMRALLANGDYIYLTNGES